MVAEHGLDQRFFPLIFDSIPHGIFTIDEQGQITSFNKAAESLTGYERHEVIGKYCHDIFKADICLNDCPLRRSIHTGERTKDREVMVQKKSGRRIPISISTAALVDDQNNILGGVEMFHDLSVVWELRKKIHMKYIFEDIVSKSPKMELVFDMLPLIANSPSTVLIEGDSGTGKELVAQAVHNLSPRKDKPFVAINCGALPDELLESELFGYKKGAFTGAIQNKPGRFALAEKGTLFLDEVSDLSAAMQVKLLRVIQEREYEPLGGTETVKMDVRIIAATNRDLAKLVKDNSFRQDLYFRLNVIKIHLPPLSERREDIPLLVQHFIDRFNALQGRRISQCSEKVMSTLMGYSFPGNVRELENAIEHAFVLCISDTIQLEDLPPHIVSSAQGTLSTPEFVEEKRSPLDNAEAETLTRVLRKNKGNRNLTAAELGISRNTLWRKMKRFDLLGELPAES